jgi:hypothetical protein
VDDKSLLLARLASERAAMWCELVGLGPELLAAERVCGDWTAADALGHVGAWDEIHAARARLMLVGRASEIALPEADALNAQIFADRHGWSLAQAAAACNAARADFLMLIEPLSWEEMAQGHQLANHQTYSIAELTERRAFHDNLHTTDLRAWRKHANPPAQPGPASILRSALDAGRAELEAWTLLVPAAQRSTLDVCGDWSAQDVLGHVADWERWLVDGLDAMAAGRMAGAGLDEDEEGWNQAHAAARRGQPWAVTWEDFTAVRRELLARLDGLGDAGLARTVHTAWSEEDHPYAWFRESLNHDREHAASVRETLTARR